jgi:hypothetical protein
MDRSDLHETIQTTYFLAQQLELAVLIYLLQKLQINH